MSFVPHPERSANEPDSRFSEAYSVLHQAISDHAFPGCAFGLLLDGQVLFADALGRFTYESDSPSVMPTTRYDIASLTKVVSTTAMAMLLYQRGQLDLDMPVGEVLPGFIIGRDAVQHGRNVTIRHLLAHSSGLPGYVPLFHTATTPYAVLRGCLELPIEAEPGTRAEYSDPGFILLGKALETIVREPIASWVTREIFSPLAMTATTFCPPSALRAEIPPTEDDELFRQRVIQGEVQDEHAFLLHGAAGHAGIFSNIPDLLRFSTAILTSGTNSLFLPATIELFSQRQPPPGSSRALGWDTPSEESSSGQYFSRQSIGHLGYSGCSLWIDLSAKLAIVLLTNRTWPHRESQLIRSVRPVFHDAVRKALYKPL
ncbi:serine hydrolase domain-containing protein [Acidicapsa ligni]|uniref:serine hydrolase domain-containing protein n=1 Tax=Acidicapsa ligni TaxID=542300 RepID=UPI0021E053E0|nr:serine hydrolase domain-containing protein [Acidicapsa ligni]